MSSAHTAPRVVSISELEAEAGREAGEMEASWLERLQRDGKVICVDRIAARQPNVYRIAAQRAQTAGAPLLFTDGSDITDSKKFTLISREDAHDPATYKAMKEVAHRTGKPLYIVG
jgi:hypothetical protein